MNNFRGHQPGHHPDPLSGEMEPQDGRRAAPAVKEVETGKEFQNGGK